jgi:agmatine/peptidylarginine deiminase
MGAQMLCLNKSMYTSDKSLLGNTSNFQILMTLMAQPEMADKKQDVLSVLTLLFPNKNIIILPKVINLIEAENPVISITDTNFEYL